MESHPGIARTALDDEWTTTDVGFWLGMLSLMCLEKQVGGDKYDGLYGLWKRHSDAYQLSNSGVVFDLPMEAYPYVYRRMYESGERVPMYCAYKDCMFYRKSLEEMGLWPAYCIVDAHIWSEI